MPTENKVDIAKALDKVKVWAKYNDSIYAQTALAYTNAMEYAKQEATYMGMSADEGERVQLLYIQASLQYWRGDTAREVKATIKARIKELS